MQQEKEKALESIRNLIAYFTAGFKEGCGYTGRQQLIYLTRSQAEIALRYGVPIGVRDTRYSITSGQSGKPYQYVTITDMQMLDKQLAASSTEALASIHADLPKGVQQKLRQYILQITEIEYLEQQPPEKPAAPILGMEGDTFKLLCIANRALRQAGQQEQSEEMWRRALDSGNCFKALAIMGEYVEFEETYLPRPMPRQTHPRKEVNFRV